LCNLMAATTLVLTLATLSVYEVHNACVNTALPWLRGFIRKKGQSVL